MGITIEFLFFSPKTKTFPQLKKTQALDGHIHDIFAKLEVGPQTIERDEAEIHSTFRCL